MSLVFFGISCQIPNGNEYSVNESSSRLIDKYTFDDISQEQIDYIKSKRDLLHSKSID